MLSSGSETSAWPAVVAIGQRPLLCGAPLVPSCTGTLIGERAVLTAAHCVDRPEVWSVFFGARAFGEGTIIDVDEVRLHPSWSGDDGAVDLAVLLLARSAPAKPMALATATAPGVAADDVVTVVGFGATARGGSPDGIKREGTSVVTEVSAASFRSRPGPSLICDGDSGGPVIAGEIVVGVSVEGDSACASWSRHESVGARREFIDAAVAGAWQPLSGPVDVCTRGCGSNDDCPRFHECEEDVDGETRCVLAPLPIGGVGAACTDDSACGGNPCVRTLGADGCHCLEPCVQPAFRAGGGGCSVSAVGR